MRDESGHFKRDVEVTVEAAGGVKSNTDRRKFIPSTDLFIRQANPGPSQTKFIPPKRSLRQLSLTELIYS